jgi:ADP-ribosylglycohydrolase
MISKTSKVEGAVRGLAYGDSWGWLTEFSTHKAILDARPAFPLIAKVTDDTQMSLYTAEAMRDILVETIPAAAARDAATIEEFENYARMTFINSFVGFYFDKDNNRAPGMTCMGSIERYLLANNKRTGVEGTDWTSQGCGANMRCGWIGLENISEEEAVWLAVLQAEVTHGHPLAAASAAVTTSIVWNLYRDTELVELEGRSVLGWAAKKSVELAQLPIFAGRTNAFRDGFRLLAERFDAAQDRWNEFTWATAKDNVCTFFGEGWVAPEALMNAVAVFALYQEQVVAGVRRLVYSSGDSDSIAAIGAMFFGLKYGFEAFPAEWAPRFEERYEAELSRVIKELS